MVAGRCEISFAPGQVVDESKLVVIGHRYDLQSACDTLTTATGSPWALA